MTRKTYRTGTTEAITRYIKNRRRGYVFTAADLATLGSRTAIDQALSRLARAGTIRRLGRGVYDYPASSGTLGMITPSAETIARAIARREGVNVQVSGARAANALGLSTQVPGRATFLTEGTSRRRRVGGLTLELRRTVLKRMNGAGRPAGVAIEALRHLGPHDATTAAVDHVLAKLRPEDQEDFMRLILSAPEWLRRLVNDSTSAKRSRNEAREIQQRDDVD